MYFLQSRIGSLLSSLLDYLLNDVIHHTQEYFTYRTTASTSGGGKPSKAMHIQPERTSMNWNCMVSLVKHVICNFGPVLAKN